MLIRVYGLLAELAKIILPLFAIWNSRIRNFLSVRKSAWQPYPPKGQRVFWMHCSSLGEFEQGRPVWEGLRSAYPEAFFLLSFFSRSGYDRQKNNVTSDHVTCLPLDTQKNAFKWMDQVHPDLILWVKYDFWFHYWLEAHRRQIPVFLFAARFRPDQFLNRRWAKPFRDVILTARTIAVQDQDSLNILNKWGFLQPLLAGDSRIDRVLEIATTPAHDSWIETFTAGTQTVICGSVWDEDMEVLFPAMTSSLLRGWRWVLAPHDLGEDRIQSMQDRCELPVVRYTQSGMINPQSAQVLILDTIGMLNQVYRWGAIAYVGGGFGRSVHNLLEPAAYGLPVLFGPKHDKFPEAIGLIHASGGFEVRTAEELLNVFMNLQESDHLEKAGAASRKWLEAHAGATNRIMAECKRILNE